jgi:hypothetical protein
MTQIFDTSTGEVVGRLEFTKTDLRAYIPGVSFSPDGKYLATCDFFEILVSFPSFD